MKRHRLIIILAFVLALAACGAPQEPEVPATITPSTSAADLESTEPDSPDAPEPTEAPAPEVSGLENAQAATVQILVTGAQFLEEFLGSGSGVIYDPEGYVLTNNHVIEGAAIVQVRVEGFEEPLPARVLGKSPCDDLAVLQITQPGDYPFAPLSEIDPTVGDTVFAIGYPLGDPVQSLTSGIVSKVNIGVATGFADYSDAIQTDAAINPGNSGGPLVTQDGIVVGINSAGFSADEAQGTNFAISMDYALSLIDQLQAGENLFWLGINAAPLPASSAAEIGISPEPGLFVYAVDSGSPADQTGIQEGDFVTSIEGVAVGADGTLEQYCNIMRSHGPDDVLDVQVIRNNARYAGQINGRVLEGGETVVDNLGGGAGSTAGSGDAPAETYNYSVVESDTGRITLQLPDRWDVLSDEITLVAADDVDAWLDSFGGSGEGSATVPGFFISAVDREDTVTLDTTLEVLNGLNVPENCTFSEDDRDTYSDPIYEGYVDYLACDNSGVYVEMIVYDPSSPNYLVWIEAFVVSDADIDMLGTALGTFIVSPP